MKKLLVVGVIVLFLGLACAPSINANVSRDNELVEITTEICGLDGGKHAVQLTKEEAEEVEQLFNDIERRLGEVETREETVEIFNDVVVDLDKYGLLGGLSIKQAQRMLANEFKEVNIPSGSDTYINENCLVYGFVDCGFLLPAYLWIPGLFIYAHPKLFDLIAKIFETTRLPLITGISAVIGLGSVLFATMINPFPIFSGIVLGLYFYCSGSLTIIGDNGKQNFSEDFFGLIGGFTGIKIWLGGLTIYLGSAVRSVIMVD